MDFLAYAPYLRKPEQDAMAKKGRDDGLASTATRFGESPIASYSRSLGIPCFTH